MNRFSKISLLPINIEPEFIGMEDLGPCYRYTEKQHEIYHYDFTIYCDLVINHYPEAKISKMNDINISNIEVHTDSLQLKISDKEFETIYKKIVDSIEINTLLS